MFQRIKGHPHWFICWLIRWCHEALSHRNCSYFAIPNCLCYYLNLCLEFQPGFLCTFQWEYQVFSSGAIWDQKRFNRTPSSPWVQAIKLLKRLSQLEAINICFSYWQGCLVLLLQFSKIILLKLMLVLSFTCWWLVVLILTYSFFSLAYAGSCWKYLHFYSPP